VLWVGPDGYEDDDGRHLSLQRQIVCDPINPITFQPKRQSAELTN